MSTGHQETSFHDGTTKKLISDAITTVPDTTELPDQTPHLAAGSTRRPTSVVTTLETSPDSEGVATLKTTKSITAAEVVSRAITVAKAAVHEKETTFPSGSSTVPATTTAAGLHEKSLIPTTGKSTSGQVKSLGTSQEVANTVRVETSPGGTSAGTTTPEAGMVTTVKQPVRRKSTVNRPVKSGGQI